MKKSYRKPEFVRRQNLVAVSADPKPPPVITSPGGDIG